jgi:hypothetical protein
MDQQEYSDPKIQELLDKYSTSREELCKYMRDLDEIRTQVSQIFPTNHDFRNRFVLEEKLKTMSVFYSTLLNIRQEFNKTLKDEIELRRKLEVGDNGDEKAYVDIREIVDMIEQQQKEKQQEKVEESDLDQTQKSPS